MANVVTDEPKPSVAINPVIEPMVREFKVALQTMYGDRLRDVVLFGSYARGDYEEESDIDLLMILNDEKVDTIAEVFRLTDLNIDFLDRYSKIISVLPVSYQRYSQSFMPVYQNARREGIFV